jgi:uncharacterized protein (DUF1501 family)
LSRRAFLHAGAVGTGTFAWSLANLPLLAGSPRGDQRSCIILFLVGGPSQLDTFDLKPAAPGNVRGPLRPMRTNVPGIEICEHFPLMAARADRFALVRSVHHDQPAIHESGQQLLQTGHFATDGLEYPHVGAVMSRLRGQNSPAVPAHVIVPGPLGDTGAGVGHGQGAGVLGRCHEPLFLRPDASEACPERYGPSAFGKCCWVARRLVEQGVSVVTVNMFDTVFDNVTWDCHADGRQLDSSLEDYRNYLCPVFDRAYAALLDDLHQRGLLDTTLVVAMGEFGRSPLLNPRGGRDHWPGVWSILLAGGGVRGGQVIGSSDQLGAEPRDRPVTPAEVTATIYHALGVDPAMKLPLASAQSAPLVEAAPIHELF